MKRKVVDKSYFVFGFLFCVVKFIEDILFISLLLQCNDIFVNLGLNVILNFGFIGSFCGIGNVLKFYGFKIVYFNV